MVAGAFAKWQIVEARGVSGIGRAVSPSLLVPRDEFHTLHPKSFSVSPPHNFTDSPYLTASVPAGVGNFPSLRLERGTF
ncbi:hypothetical protein CEXT_285031 [Caerostris extrusa]|uniref:Uncharacterized protein n=1 Tax=Caerostris extrusa TaxID=172846 RepID=A0AAV4U994_CAEEX|nr:hypothetical protein CEXT_285031 [Caerostris extrusa]